MQESEDIALTRLWEALRCALTGATFYPVRKAKHKHRIIVHTHAREPFWYEALQEQPVVLAVETASGLLQLIRGVLRTKGETHQGYSYYFVPDIKTDDLGQIGIKRLRDSMELERAEQQLQSLQFCGKEHEGYSNVKALILLFHPLQRVVLSNRKWHPASP